MRGSELPAHWRFAAGHAFAGLRSLVRSFDFLRLADGHTYAEVDPDDLIAVIDGFLGEAEGVLYGGDLADLQRLRQVLVERIRPAYEQGLAAGRQHWRQGEQVYGTPPTDELHQLALRSFPGDDDAVRGWFAEGFCRAYASEEIERTFRPQ